MTILYLTATPPPHFAETDAVFQEIETLQRAFAGEHISITPARMPGARYPRQLFGLQCLARIWKAESRTRVTQIFYPVLYCFPILRLLRNPIVYTVTASIARSAVPRGLGFLRTTGRIVVSNQRDEQKLREWGFPHVDVIRPGLELSRFAQNGGVRKHNSAAPKDGSFHLLMASAPWVEKQFDLKGVDAVLEALAITGDLSVTILLRGLFETELNHRIARLGIGGRAQIINQKVDVRDHLRAADAVVLATKGSDIVKAYPHSLLEALAAGKPVIVSHAIPMADLVSELGAGVVIDEVSAQAILAAVNSIKRNRLRYQAGVRQFDPRMFSIANMVHSYRRIYDEVTGGR